MARWRVGRSNKQIIYRQVGLFPSKDDRLTLVAFDAEEAAVVVGLLNRAEADEARQVCAGDYHVDPHQGCIMR